MPSKIEWTNETWNPFLGCSKVSSGCMQCYAVNHVHRLAGNPNAKIRAANEGLTIRHRNGQLDWSGKLRFIPERLDQPVRWKRPRLVFVNSLSDLFHADVEMRHLAAIWSVMALTPRHTYQILTKRPENIIPMICRPEFYRAVLWQADHTLRANHPHLLDIPISNPATQPLANVWLGTSVEHQAAADERIPHLEKTPAAVRFLSCEPLLGPVDLRKWLPTWSDGTIIHRPTTWGSWLNWVIVGGESGPRARPMHPAWARSLRDQCDHAGIPFFFKQWGEWASGAQPYLPVTKDTPRWDGSEWPEGNRGQCMYRVGKHAAGRLLDGREWNEMPEVAS